MRPTAQPRVAPVHDPHRHRGLPFSSRMAQGRRVKRTHHLVLTLLGLWLAGCASNRRAGDWQPLFQKEGTPEGWTVRLWSDASKPGPTGAVWKVDGGSLKAVGARGSWLMWERELGDFEMEFEFLLGQVGNCGLALRAPMKGDPAFEGLELQMADLRYNPKAKDSELTGGLYRSAAPSRQVYKPTEWNRYRIRLVGSKAWVELNGVVVQDLDLSTFNDPIQRHDGTMAAPLKNRPRRGHIGFQHLSRRDEPVEIRNARIRILD